MASSSPSNNHLDTSVDEDEEDDEEKERQRIELELANSGALGSSANTNLDGIFIIWTKDRRRGLERISKDPMFHWNFDDLPFVILNDIVMTTEI
jgi:hypothetical protein